MGDVKKPWEIAAEKENSKEDKKPWEIAAMQYQQDEVSNGGADEGFTEGSMGQPKQPSEPLKKPIINKDAFGVPETDEYLADARKRQEQYLQSVSGIITDESVPIINQYKSYDVNQLDSALTDIDKKLDDTNFYLSTRGLTQSEKNFYKEERSRLEEERAAAIVYKAEKTNDYTLYNEARRSILDLGITSPIASRLKDDVYKLENRINEDISKELENKNIDFYSLTEEDFDGIRRADTKKVSALADEIAESVADGDAGVRQIAYERIHQRAEDDEEIRNRDKKINEDEELKGIFNNYRAEALKEFEASNKEAIKYKTEYKSLSDSINNRTQTYLDKLSVDYKSDLNSFRQKLITDVQNGTLSVEEAKKQEDAYNKQIYSDLQKAENEAIQKAEKDIEQISQEYYSKIETGFKSFMENNPMSPDDLKRVTEISDRINKEVRKEKFDKLKMQEDGSLFLYNRIGLGYVPMLAKSFNSTFSRFVSGAGTYFNSPTLVEIGDEMNTSFSVADERVNDWGDLFNVPAVVKSVGRLAGSAAPSIVAGTAVSFGTGGLGTIPAMGLVATTGFVTESVDMAGNIKRDVIKETGSILKGEQAAGAMWQAQLSNWWTYIFDGLPYVGKALKAVPSRALRIGISGTEEMLTETLQETRQTAQEQTIMESIYDGGEITARDFSKKINKDLIKSTFLEVAPGSFIMGAGGRVVTEFMMNKNSNKLVKELVAKIRASSVDDADGFIKQKIFASMNQFGKNFTNSWLQTLQKNGNITEEDLSRLYTYSKTAEGFLRNVDGLNLNDDQKNIYFALSHKANELFDKAESITDDKVTRATLTEQANQLKKNAQDFLNNPANGGSFVTVNIGNGPSLVMSEEQAIEFAKNNPYVAFPESGVTMNGRNTTEFTKMFKEMSEGFKAGLADVQSIEDYATQQKSDGRLSDVENTLSRINNAEYINDNEIDTGIDQIFNEIDRIDSLDISQNAKESIKQQLYGLAETLDNYEFRTKTETRKVTTGEPVEGGAKTKREIPQKSTSKARISGVGNATVTFIGGNQISITPEGQKGKAARVTTFTFPENFLYTDEAGEFSALAIEDAEGNEIIINDPEIGIPLAINNLIAETAAVPNEVVDQFITEEINYIKETKKKAPTKAEKPTQKAPTKVEEAKPSDVKRGTGELSKEAQEDLSKLLELDRSKRLASLEDKNKNDRTRLEKVNKAVELIESSLSKVMPNIFIAVAENSDQFALFAEEEGFKREDMSKGVFRKMPVPGSKTFKEEYVIVLNPDSADAATVFHEALHGVLRAAGLSNAQARIVTGRMIQAVKKTATKKLQRELEEFTSMYETPQQNEEYIAELIGILANNYAEQNNETKSLIRRWLEKLAEIFGLKPKGVSLSSIGLEATDAAIVDLLNTLAQKLSKGEAIGKEDIQQIREMAGPLTAQQVMADMRMEEQGDLVEGADGKIPTDIQDDGPSIDLVRKSKNQVDRGSIDLKSIKRGSINDLSGSTAFVFAADQATYGKIQSPSGLIHEFYGGYLYPYGSGFGWAFTEEKAANNVLKKVNESDGIGLVMSQAPDGITGSFSFYEYLNAEINQAIKNGASPVELLNYVNEKLKITKVAQSLTSRGLPAQITSLEQLKDLMPFDGKNKVSYEVRGAFGKAFFSAKSQEMFGIPPLTKTAKIETGVLDYVNDPSLVNVEYGDIISAIQFDKNSKPERLDKSDPNYHPSYPVIIKGTPIMVFNNAVDVRKVFPNAKPKSDKASQVPLGQRDKPQAARSAMGGQYVAEVPSKIEDKTSPSVKNIMDRSGGSNDYAYVTDNIRKQRRTKPAPKKTIKAYKLFRVDKKKPGQLFPLFVKANEEVLTDVWYDAEVGDLTPDGKVKSKIGNLAYRPGWHMGDVPIATHIGEKYNFDKQSIDKSLKKPTARNENHVWAEVEVSADVNWQTEADKRASKTKDGKIIPRTAHITDQVPEDGYYRYKTNPNMTGNWIIAGAIKVNRVLTDQEVKEINDAAGVADLPRVKPIDLSEYGFEEPTIRKQKRIDSASKKLKTLFDRDNVPLTIPEAKQMVEEVYDWTTWYDGLSSYVNGLFGEYGEDVLSILPLSSMAANSSATVGMAINNVERIYKGEKPKGVAEYYGYVTDFLEGRGINSDKMYNFFKALSGDKNAVAVDMHVYSIIMGKDPNKKQVNPANKKEFDRAKEFVNTLAAELELAPREVQAALWALNILRTGGKPDSYEEYFEKQVESKGLKQRIEGWRKEGYKPFSEIRKAREQQISEEPTIRKQKKKKPSAKIKSAFEYGIQRGIPLESIKNHLISLGYSESEVISGAFEAEKIWNEDAKKINNWFEYARRSALSARKFQTQSMFLGREAMEAAISAELRKAKILAEDLNKAINRYKDQSKRDEIIYNVDQFLRDNELRDLWRDELPDDIAEIANEMRIHIDSLSIKLINLGVVKAENSRQNILDNIGSYMNRSYQLFDNKNWKNEVSDQVITAAQNYLRDAYYMGINGISELERKYNNKEITETEYNRRKNRILANQAAVQKIMNEEGVSEDEALTKHVDNVIEQILTKNDVNEYILFAQSKLGKKDLGALKRRKDIPLAIRALMGEYTDPGYNYAISVFKIANIVETQKYLTKIRDAGLGIWLFETKPKDGAKYDKITGKDDMSMSPLNGLYAPLAVANEFNQSSLYQQISSIPGLGKVYEYYLKSVGVVKYSKTILSLGTHAKNVFGNMYLMAQNGYLDPRDYQEPFSILRKEFMGSKITPEQEAKMDEWIRAGIIGQGASIGEIKSYFEGEDSFEKSLNKRIDQKTNTALTNIGKKIKYVGEKAQEAYQYEDDMFKIVAYEKEKLNYSKILFDGKSYNQLTASQKATVNDYVAEIIKNILPNYGRIGGLGKFLKAIPVAGTFISFQLEAYRTAYNTYALAVKEMKGDIPGISKEGKKLAQKRGASRISSLVAFQAFKFAVMSMLGIPLVPGDDDEDGISEYVKMLLPYWDTNSDIIIEDVLPNGDYTYRSISASDPYGSIFKVINATKNYAKTGEGFAEIFKELASPFFSEDILMNTILNIINNENDYGGSIYDEKTDTPFEVSEKIIGIIYKTFEPGSVTSTRKIIASENKLNEVIGQATGFKLHKVESLKQSGFLFRDIQNEAQKSKKAYNSIKYNLDKYESQEKINSVIKRSEEAMNNDYKEAVKLYNALISLGVSRRDILLSMKDAGISGDVRRKIANGNVKIKLDRIKKR